MDQAFAIRASAVVRSLISDRLPAPETDLKARPWRRAAMMRAELKVFSGPAVTSPSLERGLNSGVGRWRQVDVRQL